ncbi:MAG: RHS repeat-associated core domain-containing protein, partial [Acidimicrobiales bacterium]
YDPATAQFLSVDPALSVTGEPYTYVGNDPVNATDPNGMLPSQCGPDGILCNGGTDPQVSESSSVTFTKTDTITIPGGFEHASSPFNPNRASPLQSSVSYQQAQQWYAQKQAASRLGWAENAAQYCDPAGMGGGDCSPQAIVDTGGTYACRVARGALGCSDVWVSIGGSIPTNGVVQRDGWWSVIFDAGAGCVDGAVIGGVAASVGSIGVGAPVGVVGGCVGGVVTEGGGSYIARSTIDQ